MIWLLYVRFIVPVLGVFYGTSLIADEVDDKTITYLVHAADSAQRRAVRQVPRVSGLHGPAAVLPSVVIVFFLIVPIGGRDDRRDRFPSLLTDLGMLAVGLAAYGAVFAFVGTRLKRPLVVGLVFAFGWEPAVLLFPGYLKRLTVAYYLQALVPHEMPQDSGGQHAHADLPRGRRRCRPAWPGLAVIIGLALWLAGADRRTSGNTCWNNKRRFRSSYKLA